MAGIAVDLQKFAWESFLRVGGSMLHQNHLTRKQNLPQMAVPAFGHGEKNLSDVATLFHLSARYDLVRDGRMEVAVHLRCDSRRAAGGEGTKIRRCEVEKMGQWKNETRTKDLDSGPSPIYLYNNKGWS